MRNVYFTIQRLDSLTQDCCTVMQNIFSGSVFSFTYTTQLAVVIAGGLNSELSNDAVNPLRSPYKTLGKVNLWDIFALVTNRRSH